MNPSPPAQAREHTAYFDCLRVPAACAIVLLHVSAQNWDTVSVTSSAWQIFNLANSAGRWAVPVFLMISGAIWLDENRALDMQKLWRVRIFRMLTAFCFWSAVYALDSLFRGASPEEAVRSLIGGKYHMWYLPTMAGLYMLMPLLRRITESRQLTRYFLRITFLFAILIPRSLHLLRCLDIPSLSGYVREAEDLLAQFPFGSGQIYLFYFVLGHFLAKYGLPALSNRCCCLLMIGGYGATVLLNGWYSRLTGAGSTAFYSLNSGNVLCMSTGAFLLARNGLPRLRLPQRTAAAVRALSKCTFGIYLIHPLVLDALEALGLHTLSFSPFLSVPGITALVLVLSCILTALLQRIPKLQKYVV